MRFNIDVINEYVSNKVLIKNQHQFMDISFYVLNPECETKTWNLDRAFDTGIVLDTQGGVVARTLPPIGIFDEIPKHWFSSERYEVLDSPQGNHVTLFLYRGIIVGVDDTGFGGTAVKKLTEEITKNISKFKIHQNLSYNLQYEEDPEKFTLITIQRHSGKEIHYRDLRFSMLLPVVERLDPIRDYTHLVKFAVKGKVGCVFHFLRDNSRFFKAYGVKVDGTVEPKFI